MNCFRFANATNNTTISNTFNSDNSNITNIKTQHCQIMTTIKNEILTYNVMIKIPKVTNHTVFTIINFSNIIPLFISILL